MLRISPVYSLLMLLMVLPPFLASAQSDFAPPTVPQRITTVRTTGRIKLDGILDEPDWDRAMVVSNFKQVEPKQGEPAYFQTEVRLLFDDKNLYIGIFAKDTTGKQGLRTNDLTRDFSFDNNDLVGVALDTYNTKRNAIAFQVSPYGNLRDLQSFDDNIFDLDWNALWSVKTMITDKGWYAEIAIPFNTLAYPFYSGKDTVSWGINFIHIHRRSNEISAFPGFPRSFDTYRMTYAAELTGLQLPKHDVNLRVTPYTLAESNRVKTNGSDKSNSTLKAGGDIRWGNTPHSTVDLTFNTDFAQADVDQQVINLTRFSIFLPEKRQFFLENAGLLTAGDNVNLLPYFSRNIGLNQEGNPIPVIAGLKYTDRTSSRSIGALYTLENSDKVTPLTHFGVLRYIKNYSGQNNWGILVTEKANSMTNNTVAGLTGVNRFGNLRINYLYSNSFDKQTSPDSIRRTGTGASLTIDYTNNKLSFTSTHTLISKNYIPGIGFVSRSDLISHRSDVIFFLRPRWKPAYVRAYQPGIFFNLSQQASDLSIAGGYINFYPLYVVFNNGSELDMAFKYQWENVSSSFDLLGLNIQQANYRFNRYHLFYTSDQSQKIAFDILAETGGYYNGKLTTIGSDLTFSPVPNVSFIGSYQYNTLSNMGKEHGSVATNLVTATLKLFFTPRVQLSSFYQYNSELKNGRVNERFSWEYKPLSYIYLVFNSNKDNVTGELDQQSIFKISYLKQF